MNNKGKITVFLCLIMSGMILLGLTSIKIIGVFAAKEKTSFAAKTAISNIKANYNSYIFEHYHILLFDKNCNGKGEAFLEQSVEDNMSENLGGDFLVKQVAIKDIDTIIDDDCGALKQQIKDYMSYAVVSHGVDKILDATGGKDGQIPDEVEQKMDDDRDGAQEVGDENEEGNGENPGTGEVPSENHTEDPRKVTKKVQKKGLLSIVLPNDMELSDNTIDIASMPSLKYTGIASSLFKIDAGFNDYDDFKEGLHSHETWADKLVSSGVGAAYAIDVFNCATDRGRNEGTYLGCELEYLICGRTCDYDNLEGVAGKITAIRLPINYVYLLSDVSKMSKIKSIAWPLSFVTFIPEPILKYLLAGCWAYGESLMEVRSLLMGKRLEFAKNSMNWITDLDNFESSINTDAKTNKKGLDYKDYLMILLALDMKDTYYRMLDLMQVNANMDRQINNDENGVDDTFLIENAAVNISFDIKVLFDGREICVSCMGGY